MFEAECIKGLEAQAADELKKIGAKFPYGGAELGSGTVSFRFGKSLTRFGKLRVVNQVFGRHTFDIPRPKAFLGQQHFDRMRQILHEAVNRLGKNNVQSFRLEAAGRESAVFQRLIAAIEADLGVPHMPEAGDLFLRIKPSGSTGRKKGWDLLVRQTVRPLATRSWRQVNYPGALAAPVAAVMLDMANIRPHERLLNVMCGSGTLLAEQQGAAGLMAGCDLNGIALRGAASNIAAAGVDASLFLADAVQLPFAPQSFDVLLADLPWGQLIGDVTDIQTLYPQVLAEGWRLCAPSGRFVIVTQLKKLMRQAIQCSRWTQVTTISLQMGRVNPDIYLLERRD